MAEDLAVWIADQAARAGAPVAGLGGLLLLSVALNAWALAGQARRRRVERALDARLLALEVERDVYLRLLRLLEADREAVRMEAGRAGAVDHEQGDVRPARGVHWLGAGRRVGRRAAPANGAM